MSYIEGLVALNAFLWSLSSTIHQCNTVGALSQKTFSSTALLVISLAILLVGIGWVTYQYKNLKSFGLFSWILFLGGGCANMIERIRFSCVHDTLPFLFNIANNPADWSLGIGFFLILLYYGGWKPYK
ncbi:MAG: signal peptidase II [Candidatus Moraniibacteriota bacterium]